MNLWQGYFTFPGLVFLVHVYGLPTDELSQTSDMSCTVQNIPNGYFKYTDGTRLNQGRMVPNTLQIIPICNNGYIKDSDQYLGCRDGHWDKEVNCTAKPCPSLWTPPSKGIYNTISGFYGDVITLTCNTGYYLLGPGQRTCGVNGAWSPSGSCQVKSCPSLSSTTLNGKYSATSGVFGDVITLTCDHGYDLHGQGQITCGAGGTWSSSFGRCQAISCSYLWATPSNGRYNATSGVYGDVITLTCNHGYVLQGPGQITCSVHGIWSSSLGSCQAKPCPALSSSPSNGTYTTTSGVYGDVVTLICNHGYDLDGPGQRTCGADGKWSPSGSCQAKPCPSLSSSPSNGTYNTTSGVYGDVVTLICNHGYDLDGPGQRTCGADGKWSPSGSCQVKNCGALVTPPHGQYNLTSGWYRAQSTLICDKGYQTKTPVTRTCQADGTWSLPVGTCQAQPCGSPGTTEHDSYSSTTGVYQDIILLLCDTGYQIQTPINRTCQANGTWSPVTEKCQPRVKCEGPQLLEHGHYSLGLDTTAYYQDRTWFTCVPGYVVYVNGHQKDNYTRMCVSNRTWDGHEPQCLEASFCLGKDSETYPWTSSLVGVGIGVALSLLSVLIIFASVAYTRRRRKKKSSANELYTIPTATREETTYYDELGRPDSFSGGNSMEEANQYEITDP